MLERGEVANSWRRERWDSLRLLTPNWQSRLPGLGYEGPDPDGYMTMGEVTEFIERFAAISRAPVRTGTTVTSVRPADDGYHVMTTHGEIRCRAAVIASGACNRPAVLRFTAAVPESVEQLTPFDYRDPAKLPDGGVLVVGASATGVQLAAEVQRSGRPGHVRRMGTDERARRRVRLSRALRAGAVRQADQAYMKGHCRSTPGQAAMTGVRGLRRERRPQGHDGVTGLRRRRAGLGDGGELAVRAHAEQEVLPGG